MGAVQKRALDVLFLGSDAFSIGSLNALLRRRDLWSSLHVVTPSSKAIGRKKKDMYEAPLASVALDNGLETTQVPYENFKQWKPPRPFDALSPSHVLVTASFGAILPKSVLGLLPPHQTLNVHPSLLPRYRGASPIQYALLNRDQTTGVTVQELSDRGADTGAIFAQEEFDIPPNATYGSLVAPLADLGGSLLVKTLETLADGTAAPKMQSADGVIKAPKIRKELASLDFGRSAAEIDALYRAVGHQLVLRADLPTDPRLGLLLHSMTASTVSLPHPPGSCAFDPRTGVLEIACGGGGHLRVSEVQVQFKKRTDARTAWAGLRDRKLVGPDGRVQLDAAPLQR